MLPLTAERVPRRDVSRPAPRRDREEQPGGKRLRRECRFALLRPNNAMKRVFHLTTVVGCGVLLSCGAGAAGTEAGYVNLFNGHNLDGWKGLPGYWSVRDGAITGETTADHPLKHNTFLIWQGGEVGDFVLRLRFRIVPGDAKGFGNSGIQYRSRVFDPAGCVVGGYQADFEAGKTYSGILYEERGRGIIARRGQKVHILPDGKKEVIGSLGRSEEIQAVIKPRQWNDYTIVARGNHLAHYINGRITVSVWDEQTGRAARSGVLALQLHAGPPMTVQFKDIRLKTLSPARKLALIAGGPSHGVGEHEHRAGCLLFQKCLAHVPGLEVAVYSRWPRDPAVLDEADAIVIYADGGRGHPALRDGHRAQLRNALERGAGFGCIHYAVEVPKEEGAAWLAWLGGYFETGWSVNPFWTATFDTFPAHPITRGVHPFSLRDEWYYHMRFRPEMRGITPLLRDLPPAGSLQRPDGPHSNNPAVRAAVLERHEPQVVMWAATRPEGGRSFGFTGGHYHRNWGQDDFRKIVLNALLWVSGVEVPANGVESRVTPEELQRNLDRR